MRGSSAHPRHFGLPDVERAAIARPALHDAFVHIVRQVDAGFDATPESDAIEEAAA